MQGEKSTRLQFGLFEVDLATQELWKAGFRVRLQSQPFRVLLMLLELPGQVVTRESMQGRLWGDNTVVDFDHSLGTAINKIREALGDSAENPRFVETLSRRGYRFIAPVKTLAQEAPAAPPPMEIAGPVAELGSGSVSGAARVVAIHGARQSPWRRWGWVGVPIVGAVLCVGSYQFGRSAGGTIQRISQLTHSGNLAADSVLTDNLAVAVTDGHHIYAMTNDQGHAGISVVSTSDGSVTSLNVPEEIAGPALGDISRDGTRLLLREHLSPELEQALWIVPTAGGSAQRVGNVLAHDATWMPDGKSVLFANGNRLLVSDENGGNVKTMATTAGRAFWLRWSPDGSLLRFTLADPGSHTLSLWQLPSGGDQPEPLLQGFSRPAAECCGVWLRNGSTFVFQSSRGGSNNLWQMDGKRTEDARRLTDGPLPFDSPIAAAADNSVFFLGADSRVGLERLTPQGMLVPVRGMLAKAERLQFSRDGQWVAWTDSAGQLWRAHPDGSERLRISPDALNVFLASWSPDAAHLAIMGRKPGSAWQIYLVNADGSGLHTLLHEGRNAADPSWSPDGNRLVFGRTNDRFGEESARTLEFVDIRTGEVSAVPRSEGLFSPRWSPDGRYIVALSLDQRRVMLLDTVAGGWRQLAVTSGADPVWSVDSKAVFLHGALQESQPISRISIPDGRVKELASLAGNVAANAVDYTLAGIDATNTPLVRVRLYTGDLFSATLPK